MTTKIFNDDSNLQLIASAQQAKAIQDEDLSLQARATEDKDLSPIEQMLPTEIWLDIAQHFTDQDLGRMRQVKKNFLGLFDEEFVTKVFFKRFEECEKQRKELLSNIEAMPFQLTFARVNHSNNFFKRSIQYIQSYFRS